MEKRFALERERSDRLVRIITPFISVVIAMLIGSLFILASGHSPVAAFAALWQGAFGSQRAIGETLLRSTPLIFTGLALAYGFRSGLFNIGAEGQLFLGGLAAAVVGLYVGGMSWFVSIPIILFSAALAGAAWAFIPALMKARIGANEVITTMMFSYIGRYFVSWVITGPMKDKGGIPQTPQLPPNSILPRLNVLVPFLKPTRAHTGILIAIRRGRSGVGRAQVHDTRLRGARGGVQPVRVFGRRYLGLIDHHQVAVHLGGARRPRRGGRGDGRLRTGCSTASRTASASRGSRSRCSRRTTRSA